MKPVYAHCAQEPECRLEVLSDDYSGLYLCAQRDTKDSNGHDDTEMVDFRLSPVDALRIGTALVHYAMHGRIPDDE